MLLFREPTLTQRKKADKILNQVRRQFKKFHLTPKQVREISESIKIKEEDEEIRRKVPASSGRKTPPAIVGGRERID